jgi:hypothetical protein
VTVHVCYGAGNLTNWLPKNTAGKEDLDRASDECLFAYHTAMHNHSFRSMDCTSKIIKNLYDFKFSAARTKTEAIVTDVIAPLATEELAGDLRSVPFVSLSTDASNHHATKMLPVLVQYFLPETGIHVKMLAMSTIVGETSDIITKSITDAMERFELDDKVIGFSADNTNANFGGARRRGQENVFTKLRTHTGIDLLGLGCNAHMLHNTAQNAADSLPVDAEQIVAKLYNYFSIYTVRVAQLEEFCDFVDVEYRKLLGYSKTRWLALLPAVERILQMFPALKSYFMSIKQCPVVLKQFFENPLSEAWMFFIQCQASLFNKVTTSIQYQHGTAMEVRNELMKIKTELEDRKAHRFVGIETRNILRKLENAGDIAKHDADNFISKAVGFYDSCLEYISLWDHSEEVKSFDWVLLTRDVKWEEVEESMNVVLRISAKTAIIGNELFSQTMCVKRYTTLEIIARWTEQKMNASLRWREVFQHFSTEQIPFDQVLKIVQFALALPGTNAPVERVFSLMNDMWSEDKSQMVPETVESILLVRVNIGMNCIDFHKKIKGNVKILQSVHSSSKYKWFQSIQRKKAEATASATVTATAVPTQQSVEETESE